MVFNNEFQIYEPIDTTAPLLNEDEHQTIAKYVHSKFGIKLPKNKAALIQGRLAKRLRYHKKSSYQLYFDFIMENSLEAKKEYEIFVDLITTHETHFFRDRKHFSVLKTKVLPKVHEKKKKISVFSAACSTGQEIYSLAMLLKWLQSEKNYFNEDIWLEGIDLSQYAIERAKLAVYERIVLDEIPQEFIKAYLLKHKNSNVEEVKMAPEIRSLCHFHTGNLLKVNAISLQKSYDIIFCKNALIYFSEPNQFTVIQQLINMLNPGGYLFLGLAESLHGHNFKNLKLISPSVYFKTNGVHYE